MKRLLVAFLGLVFAITLAACATAPVIPDEPVDVPAPEALLQAIQDKVVGNPMFFDEYTRGYVGWFKVANDGFETAYMLAYFPDYDATCIGEFSGGYGIVYRYAPREIPIRSVFEFMGDMITYADEISDPEISVAVDETARGFFKNAITGMPFIPGGTPI